MLKSKKKNEEIWELVVWEYGTTLYTMASILQDHPPIKPQVGQECQTQLLYTPLVRVVPVMSYLCLTLQE